jgi:hypothetical protein
VPTPSQAVVEPSARWRPPALVRRRVRPWWSAAVAVVLLALVPGAAVAQGAGSPVAVDFVNASRPTRCAEEDNVYVTLTAPAVTAFRITAEHPPYIGSVTKDSTAPDFTDCDMSNDPRFRFTPRTVVLYEDAAIRLVGHTFETFWRPEVVDFRVGDRNEPGLHLVQLLQRRPTGDIEKLVVYPSDGYWRPKPLPPANLPDTAYGSSFLFGPVEEDGRPYVAIRSIAFDPAGMTFRLVFRNGSRGMLSVASATGERLVLSLSIDPPVSDGRPFAALRSMFVRIDQADVAVASWPGPAAVPHSEPIMTFRRFSAPSGRFGRVDQSRHNLSAPDLVFDGFVAAPKR